MQLYYRGNNYQASNHYINTVKSGITAQFLGKTYTLRHSKYQNFSQADLYKYRGVIYQK